ncbi:ABC transporter ATP-binding protein [Georgenia satyanarayanai]|uniref:ATP-binding cassette domain-containing protein n=1 Tax=Georgenia satyanarayanai TaxID=860221 RepID=UPI00204189A1|nr:ABC transporter ATP-binding protein [Georgenia satyanarayanai]MCM3660934.1 ABC transporter ATP-binding protein [Georgenia satyanarayanai]
MSTVLDVAGLTVAFPGVGEVLRGVDLRLEAGRCLAVVGESGAGKSVLARSLVGLAGEGGAPARVRAGRLTVNGRDLRVADERQWRALRGQDVGLVLQDALQSLDPLRTVGAEVGEALAVRGVGRAERHERVLAALAAAGLDEPAVRAAQRSGELSGGMRQRALIASAIVSEPALLVADEPTTALDATVAQGVLEMLGRLRDAGTAILLVSHDLGAVARLADDVVVLDGGRVVESGPAGVVLTTPAHEVTRALLDAVPRGTRPPVAEAGREVLRASGLHRRYRLPGGGSVSALDDVSLVVRRGEAVGVVGESGSGKSTLARMLVAAEQPDAGRVELAGEPWSELPERRRRSRRHLVRLVPQDPLGSFDPRWSAGRVLRAAIRASGGDRTPAELLELVRLPPGTLGRRPRALSGGQRQRLAIARALAADPEVLVLDEPVSALDVTVQAAILELLVELQERTGTALVLVSHDLAVVRQVCHAVVVMQRGRVVEEGPVDEVWQDPKAYATKALLTAATPPTP